MMTDAKRDKGNGTGKEALRSIRFVVPGAPFAKQRPRFTGAGPYAMAYTPRETKNHEAEVAACFLAVADGRMFAEKRPLDVRIQAYYQIPKSTSKKKRELMKQRKIRPVVKPDLDNVEKLICDALNGVAWHDDNAIVDMQIRKFYSDTPQVAVTIYDVGCDE